MPLPPTVLEALLAEEATAENSARRRSFTEQLLTADGNNNLEDDEAAARRGSIQQQQPAAIGGGRSTGGKSSTFSSVMNLSNTILGAGALAMPFACAQTGLLLFAVLLVAIALCAHLAVRMLALCVDKHSLEGARYSTLGQCAFGRLGSNVAMLAVALQQLGPCVIYIQISADILVPILCEFSPSEGPGTAACNESATLRVVLQLAVVTLCMLPLSMIRSMDSLKFASTLSMLFMACFALLVVVRGLWVLSEPSLREQDFRTFCCSTSIISGSTSGQDSKNNILVADDEHDDDRSGWRCDVPPGTEVAWIFAGHAGNPLKAIPIICFAFLCHQNMFPVYEQLHEASHKRMAAVSKYSIMLCCCVYFLVGSFGYLIFLERARTDKGDVLNLFDVSMQHGGWFQIAMNIARLGYGLAVILSYPIMLFELRHIVQLLAFGDAAATTGADDDSAQSATRRQLCVNLCVIVPCTVVALLVSDVDVVFGLVGSTMSPAIIFIMPAAFYLKLQPEMPAATSRGRMRPVAWCSSLERCWCRCAWRTGSQATSELSRTSR